MKIQHLPESYLPWMGILCAAASTSSLSSVCGYGSSPRSKIAASWMFAPEFLPPLNGTFCQVVTETDAVITPARFIKSRPV